MVEYNIIDNINALEISIKNISEETKEKLGILARTIYQAPLASLDLGRLRSLVMLDISSVPEEITISAGSTRKTEVQYCTNNYHASLKLSCSFYKEAIALIFSTIADPAKCLEEYFKLKAGFYALLKEKINTNENFVRSCLRDAEVKDGIPPQGRFAQQ